MARPKSTKGAARPPSRLAPAGRPSTPADQNSIRDLNRSLVLDALRRSGPASRADLARLTMLTKPTVSAIIDELVQSGLVVERGAGSVGSAGGRPPTIVEFNGRSQFFVGVEIREEAMRLGVVDATGRQVATRDAETPKSIGNAVAQVERLVRASVDEIGAPLSRVGGLGLVVPGLVDETTGVCLLAPNIGWRDEPVGPLLAAKLPVAVFVRNHAMAWALAEATEGAGRDGDVVAVLIAGVGVGAGVTVGGELYAGAAGVAAEIGHCRVPGATRRCSCGRKGCLETVASVRGVLQDAGARTRPSGPSVNALAELADASHGGDARARAALDRAGVELGIAGSFLVNLFGPDVVVTAGSVFEVDEVVARFRESLAEHALPPLVARLALRSGELGPDAGLRGALLTAMGGSPLARTIGH